MEQTGGAGPGQGAVPSLARALPGAATAAQSPLPPEMMSLCLQHGVSQLLSQCPGPHPCQGNGDSGDRGHRAEGTGQRAQGRGHRTRGTAHRAHRAQDKGHRTESTAHRTWPSMVALLSLAGWWHCCQEQGGGTAVLSRVVAQLWLLSLLQPCLAARDPLGGQQGHPCCHTACLPIQGLALP